METSLKLLCIDMETSITPKVYGNCPTFRSTENDIYTQIWATHEEWVGVVHCEKGWGRKIYLTMAEEMFYADVIVGHNLSFDLSYIWNNPELQQFILKGGKIWDTQVAEYILTGQQHSFSSLAELQLKHLGQVEKPNRISALFKKGIGADKIIAAQRRCPRLWELYNKYCRLDGVTPLKIYKKQYALAQSLGMVDIIELYNDYLLAIINMTCSGIKVDVVKCEKTLRDFNLKHLELLMEAQEILKSYWKHPRLPEFLMNSGTHKSAVLFGGNVKIVEREKVGVYKNGNPKYKNVEKLIWMDGFRIPTSISRPTKKSGVYVTDDNVMQKIAAGTKNAQLKKYCELQKQALMYKKAAKTYCQAFINRSVEGTLYPNFNNTLTTTSRLSSSAPNMQNISKRNEFGKILHSLFVAPKGWKCVQIDFAQLEIWVLAFLSSDGLLTKHLLDGVDLHTVRLQYYNPDMTYEELYKLAKIDKDPYWDKQRTYAKTVSYQMAYGAQPKKVVESTGLDLEIVETIFKKEAETYVDAASFGDIVRREVENSVDYSRANNIPASQKKGKDGSRILGNVELLPIFDKSKEVSYTNQEIRRVGYYKSPTNKRYHFLDAGRMYKGHLSRSFSFTQPKNYPMQGTAADVQGATTAELLVALLKKSDRIKMINEVHDSKWFYVREDVLAPCLKWLKETIEDVPKIFKKRFNIDVPFKFPVDIEVGDNFGSMEKYEINS